MRVNLNRSRIEKAIVYSVKDKIGEIHEELHSAKLEMTGWVSLPIHTSDECLNEYIAEAERLRGISESIVIIGIGGSYLGAKACFDMIKGQFSNYTDKVKIYFAGFNMSATYHKALLNEVKKGDFSVIAVSKSGSTTETKAAFTLFKNALIEQYSTDYNKHITVISESGSLLYNEAQSNSYSVFEMPKDVGGRYSVLTVAGLLPIAAMGIDIKKIINGAKRAFRDTDFADIRDNACYQYAAARRLIATQNHKNIEIYCFYEPGLEYFGEWLVQLFGESEGKKQKGIYPTTLLLTRDLHSMGQFLQDGSKVFFETLISVNNAGNDIAFDETQPTYNEYNTIIAQAVVKSHKQNPLIRFHIDDLSEETFGYMVYFFEKACAVSSMMLGVNPFDQPGVEVYKQKVKQLTAEFRQNFEAAVADLTDSASEAVANIKRSASETAANLKESINEVKEALSDKK